MSANSQSPQIDTLPDGAEDETSLPFLRSWPRVYAFVAVIFGGYVILLTILSRVFA